MPQPPRDSWLPLEVMRASEQPLERLNLLEEVQGKQGWLATVVADSAAEVETLHALKATLEKKSYHCFLDKNYEGRDVLRVHHVGEEVGIVHGLAKLGLLRGSQHAADQVVGGIKALGTYATDPAHLSGALYLLGDFVGMGAGDKQDLLPKNLKRFSFALAVVQSVAYMCNPKDAGDNPLRELRDTWQDCAHNGGNAEEMLALLEPSTPPNKSPSEKAKTWMKSHVLEFGAATQVLGQISMMLSGGINVVRHNTGHLDIVRGFTSATAWTIMAMGTKPRDEEALKNANPLANGVATLRANPEHTASVLCTLASLIGLLSSTQEQGSSATKEKTAEGISDKGQGTAEALYLLGDAAIFFIGNDKKKEGKGRAEMLAETAAAFLQESPTLFSESKQTAFVHKLADYMAHKMVEKEMLSPALNAHPDSNSMAGEAKDALAQEIAIGIFKELAGKERKIDKVANSIARLSMVFPEERRAAVETTLVATIANSTGAVVEPNELQGLIAAQRAKLPESKESPASLPSMMKLSPLLAELTFQLPSCNATRNASRLFDALTPHIRSVPAQEKMFEGALMRQAAVDLGISPHMAASFSAPERAGVSRQ
jgi:hypothetical protein